MSTKQTKAKWVFAAAVTEPDPRINPENPEHGRRTVSVLYGIDSLGRLWREINTDASECLGRPPKSPPKA